MKMQATEVIHFQKSPSSDFICAGYKRGMLFSGYCMILIKFCLETNSLFSLFAFLGFILTSSGQLNPSLKVKFKTENLFDKVKINSKVQC